MGSSRRNALCAHRAMAVDLRHDCFCVHVVHRVHAFKPHAVARAAISVSQVQRLAVQLLEWRNQMFGKSSVIGSYGHFISLQT